MRQLIREPHMIETIIAPIIRFDGIGRIIVDDERRIWWPLYLRQPSMRRPGTFDLVLQAWTVTRLDVVPGAIEQTNIALAETRQAHLRLLC